MLPIPKQFLFFLMLPACLFAISTSSHAQWSTAEKTDEYFVNNANLRQECSHIEFLTNTEANRERVPSDLKEQLITPGKYQRKLVILSLNELSDFVCKSVRKVAFYGVPGGTAEAGSAVPISDRKKWASIKGSHPDLINIYTTAGGFSEEQIMPTAIRTNLQNEYFSRLEVSYSQWPDLMKTIIHEAAHCAMYLIESQTGIGGQRPWPADVQSEAKKIVEKAGLEKGFAKEWARTHRSFRSLRWAEDYDDDISEDLTAAPADGFLTLYGQRDAWEDVADTFALLVLNDSTVRNGGYADELQWANVLVRFDQEPTPNSLDPDTRSNLLPHYVMNWYDPCKSLRSIEKVGVTQSEAAVYTKMMFLIDVQFIDEEVYRRCAAENGEPKLRFSYGRTDNGFHRVDYDSGVHIVSYGDIDVEFPDSPSEPQVFTVVGKGVLNTDDGKSHDTEMRLEVHAAKKPSLPRGVYVIPENLAICPRSPSNWSLYSRTAPWTFTLKVPDAPSKSFCVTSGYLLVTRATTDFIEASMLALTVLKHVLVDVPERPNFKVYIRWKRN